MTRGELKAMTRMIEPALSSRLASLAMRVAALLATPLAPLYGLAVAWRLYHPPRPRRRRAPSAFGLHPAECWINGPSARARLHAWHLGGDPERVVVLGHGMGLDKSRSLAQAQLLRRAGYTVVLFDFRNHGASFRDHALTGFSHRFDDDLVAVVDQVRAMPEHAHARIALWGFSFSTFPVLDTLARLGGAVHAVICDSGPTRDLSAIVNGFPRSGLLPVPRALQAAPARPLWQAVYRRLAMAMLDAPADWPPAAQPGVSATPMLFVVGDRDPVTPVDQVRAVARRYPYAEVLVMRGAGHLHGIKVDGDAYAASVLDFLTRALSEGSGRGAAAHGRWIMNRLRPGVGVSRRQLVATRPSTASSANLGRAAHRSGLARAVTELLAPANLAVAQLLLVGWHSTPGPVGLGWGLLTATFCGLLPYGIVIAGVRRQRWTDRHLRARQQRPAPFLAAIASVLAGLAMLLALDAPRQLVALVAAMLAGLAATLLVTLWWKLSVHTAAASGSVAILALTFGPALILTVPTVALVAWSRVRLGDHTLAQTLAGAALGGLVATTVFLALR